MEDEEDELTEKEKCYMEKKKAEWSKAKVTAGRERKRVSAYGSGARNGFLPLASNRWVESMSCAFGSRIWNLDTYNYVAPFDVRGYTLMATVGQDETKSCFDRAMDMVTVPPKVKFPFSGDGVSLPRMSVMDGTKCSSADPSVSIKGPMRPQNPAPMPELKRIWNMGKPYVKCRCVTFGRDDCGKGPAWFDHLLWFIFRDLDILFPDAPSLKAKVWLMLGLLEGSWRPLVLWSIIFNYMREAMMVLVKKVMTDPTLTAETVLNEVQGAENKMFKEVAKLLLPNKYLKKTTGKRQRPDVTASSSKRLQEDAHTSLDAFMESSPQSTPATDQPEKDLTSSVNDQDSSWTACWSPTWPPCWSRCR
ncbi:hypothetical protein CBR_g23919 [Chara braunii]|uniref:Uncharacterized protein n=1 Tax=Chara braunii TaxID=69332 RepID=A0A388L587_CHABU|nr:hypothetical protein CBR_g23919 [Chara braunii]|eukprot:GBG77471.1 hypothetical protein CBR_g23919 [Chara braunii]